MNSILYKFFAKCIQQFAYVTHSGNIYACTELGCMATVYVGRRFSECNDLVLDNSLNK